jgi:SM-20-related protein
MTLSAGEIEQLGERGWFVRDGFLSDAESRAACDEITALELRPAGMVRGHHDTAERGDYITWLDIATAPPALQTVCERLEDLRRALGRDAWLPTARAEIQAAHYPGGGARYVRHRDALAQGNQRRITIIVYLNADWKPADGGQLRLGDGTEIEPIAGRLIVFLSERVEHEVLPAHAPRFAITAWCYP